MSYELPAVIFETADRKAARKRMLLEDIATNANSLLISRMAKTPVRPPVLHTPTWEDIYDTLPATCPDCTARYKDNDAHRTGERAITRADMNNSEYAGAIAEFKLVPVGETRDISYVISCPRCGDTRIKTQYTGRYEK